jgi:ABC-type thiamin/hydroxymethylpyrimidine transport system permease subunit
LSENNPTNKQFYFSTRDLLITAVLAALGGVASTYVNTLGDAVQAFLGTAGGSQWAAGLHVIWIVLALGITGKSGTGVITGLLKGGVELLSGNSHGVIILLVDLVAGLLVDFGFLLFRNKRTLLPYLIAGGLSAGSNVFIFQLFATLPSNILALGAIFFLFFIALISGLLFGGVVPKLLIDTLTKADIVKTSVQPKKNRRTGWIILVAFLILAAMMTIYLKSTLKGAARIQISGAVENSYAFPDKGYDLEMVTRQMENHGILTEYTGYPLEDIIAMADPVESADTVLIEASDGYAFLISFEELETNPNILAVREGQGQSASFDIVGPESSKAWVRNVIEINVIVSQGLMITDPAGEIHEFDPDQWVSEMDSTQVALPEGSKKLQGVPLWKVIKAYADEETPQEISLRSPEKSISYDWADIDGDDSFCLFTVIEKDVISFALAEISGEVHLFPVTELSID